MLKEYLFDIATTNSITEARLLVGKFLGEWKGLLLEVDFIIDDKGIIQKGPREISDYQKAIEEYIVLRCLYKSFEKNELKTSSQNCCASEWEHYNLPEDLYEKCRKILEIISAKFGNPNKAT